MTRCRPNVPKPMYRLSTLAALTAVSLAMACGEEYSDQQCDDLRDQIAEALASNVDKGVLVASAVPCGAEGIANDPESFDPRVSLANRAYLTDSFADACGRFEDHCQ